MNRTLEEFTKVKGCKSLTSQQLRVFCVTDLKKGWFKRFKNNEVTEEGWANAILSLEDSKHVIPMRKMISSREGQYVYLFKNPYGFYKIGISNSPKKRASSIQSSSGVPITICSLWLTGQHKAIFVEKAAHTFFRARNTMGEWFSSEGVDFEAEFRTLMHTYSSTGVSEVDISQIKA